MLICTSPTCIYYVLFMQSLTLARAKCTQDSVMAMHGTSIDSVEDMAILGDLHEAAILYNIYQRYSKDIIYVSLPPCNVLEEEGW